MMAGDVTAAIVNGDLVVTGDAAANGVRVEYMAYDAWRVTGFMTSFTAGGATRVNGQSIVEFNASSVTGAIRVNLGGGNDVLDFTTKLTSLGVNTPGDVFVNTGDGNDTVEIHSAIIGDDLIIDTGAGNDRVTLDLVQVGDVGLDGNQNDLAIHTGSGADIVDIFLAGASGDTLIDTGMSGATGHVAKSADDIVSLQGYGALGLLTIRTGDGNDTVHLDTAGSGEGIVISTGDGDDEVTIDVTMSESNHISDGDLTVEMGLGNDTFNEGDFSVSGRKTIRDTNRTTVEPVSSLDKYFARLGSY